MTGRPGYRTMEMNGGSSSPYLACTPCVPLFVHCLIRVEAEGLSDYQGRGGDHFHCTVEPSPGHIRCRFPEPPTTGISQKYCRYKWEAYCGTNRRRVAVQIGSGLRRFPFLKAWKPERHSVTNGGGVLRYKLEVYCRYFSGKLYGLGFLNSPQV